MQTLSTDPVDWPGSDAWSEAQDLRRRREEQMRELIIQQEDDDYRPRSYPYRHGS